MMCLLIGATELSILELFTTRTRWIKIAIRFNVT